MSRLMCEFDMLLLCVNNYRGEDYNKPESCVDCQDCIFNPVNKDLAEDPNDSDKVICLTKKEMKKLEKQRKINEIETLYICETCGEKLTGMKEIPEHIQKHQHYKYKDPNHPTVRLMIG